MSRTRDSPRAADRQKTRTGTGSLRSPNLSLSANTTHAEKPEKHEREFGETNTNTSMNRATKRKEYGQPKGLVAAFLWRLWMKIQTTFALSMLETWEIILIFVITGSITLLISAALIRLLPRILLFISQQAHFFRDSFGFGFGLQVADAGSMADLAKDVI